MPNLRYTARGRPQSLQRFSRRVENFGSRLAFAILLLLATGCYPVSTRKTGGECYCDRFENYQLDAKDLSIVRRTSSLVLGKAFRTFLEDVDLVHRSQRWRR